MPILCGKVEFYHHKSLTCKYHPFTKLLPNVIFEYDCVLYSSVVIGWMVMMNLYIMLTYFPYLRMPRKNIIHLHNICN